MPQVDAYMLDPDFYELAEHAFSEGCTIVPDVELETPGLPEIINVSELEQCRRTRSAKLFFVLSRRWQAAPLELRKFEREGRELYYIAQKTGGPTIDVYLPQPYEKEQRTWIPAGFIGYHKSFWNQQTQRNDASPEELIAQYERLISFIRRGATERRQIKRRYFITPRVQRATEAGAVLA